MTTRRLAAAAMVITGALLIAGCETKLGAADRKVVRDFITAFEALDSLLSRENLCFDPTYLKYDAECRELVELPETQGVLELRAAAAEYGRLRAYAGIYIRREIDAYMEAHPVTEEHEAGSQAEREAEWKAKRETKREAEKKVDAEIKVAAERLEAAFNAALKR